MATALNNVSELIPLIEQIAEEKARKIVKEILDKQQFDVPKVPDHHHNGNDSNMLSGESITNFAVYPSTTVKVGTSGEAGVLSPTTLNAQTVVIPPNGQVSSANTGNKYIVQGVPIPIIYGFGTPGVDPNADFHGGAASLGSAILFINPSNKAQIFFRADRDGFTEGWWGVDLIEVEA